MSDGSKLYCLHSWVREDAGYTQQTVRYRFLKPVNHRKRCQKRTIAGARRWNILLLSKEVMLRYANYVSRARGATSGFLAAIHRRALEAREWAGPLVLHEATMSEQDFVLTVMIHLRGAAPRLQAELRIYFEFL
ncbi:hypothetical protein NDU88_002390 [Pleurodeles waltl]|uniref:Uncharacterized protein n=1 Tax=Pleurodeles waltl TaxID=8319 RepID=A0AAV7MAV3_PLEWA|nr:hypothetical protein NDU88_002390 [Pleurodeles waltl]